MGHLLIGALLWVPWVPQLHRCTLETLEVRKDENCGTEIVFFSLLENRFPGQISFTLEIANASKLSLKFVYRPLWKYENHRFGIFRVMINTKSDLRMTHPVVTLKTCLKLFSMYSPKDILVVMAHVLQIFNFLICFLFTELFICSKDFFERLSNSTGHRGISTYVNMTLLSQQFAQ